MVDSGSGASASMALFQESAARLAERLENETSLTARRMADEAAELAHIFEAWTRFRPRDDVRVAKIQQLLELNRRVMDFLSSPPLSRRGED